MPRPNVNLARRTIAFETGRRTVDIPVDGNGRLRSVATLDSRSIVRAAGDDEPIGFRGHAAVFSTRTWIGSKRWGFWEEIAPGAFAKAIVDGDVRMLHNHDPNLLLARNKSGTLRLSEDAVGLAVEADMAPTSYARDLAISLEREDTTQMSFGFVPIDYEWRVNTDDTETLIHREVELWDVSTVTYPAYVETDAALRQGVLACARAAGFDSLMLDELGRRFDEPDEHLIEMLRAVARRTEEIAPADATRDADPVSADEPAAEGTGTRSNPLVAATLAARMKEMAHAVHS